MLSDQDPLVDPDALATLRDVADEAFGRGASWADLAAAGVLGAVLPEAYDGGGLGLLGACEVLRAQGSVAGVGPVVDTLAVAATVLVAHGSEAQRARLLPGIGTGQVRIAAALSEPGRTLPATAQTTLRDGRIFGRKIRVAYAGDADAFLVSAVSDGQPVLALVAGDDPHASLVESPSSSGEPTYSIAYDGAVADVLPGAGAAALAREAAIAGLCVRAAGLVAGARDLTAAYVKQRTQFGRALAQFQAVAQQAADVYIASRTLALAAANAVWRVGRGLDAADDLAVAAYWTCAQAPAALHACHHLHGGMGVDVTYPLARYYSQVTDLVHELGGVAATGEALAVESGASKNLELTAGQRSLKSDLRAYFAGLVTAAEHREMMTDRHGATYQRIIKQMGSDGWMGVGWPEEYGGQGFGEIEQTIFANEAQYADVHLPAVTLQTVGPTLQRFGTAEQKARFLGPILSGDVHFAIGYSEPDAGTDLASLRTSARLVTDDGEPYYLVNGQKMWTTGGHQADFIWLAARTDPEAPKHRGISILIVDTRDPGYSWTPIITADGSHHVNATYFHDVRVPVSMLVGEENQGWRLITTQLNHERVMLGPAGRIEGLRDRVAAWAHNHGVADRADVRATLGRTTAVFRVNELLNWEVARSAQAGEISVADASASKVFAAGWVQELGRELADVVHRYGDPADPETGELLDYLDKQAKRNLVLTFGGGVTEVQKELISMFGLGLPKVPR